LQAAHPDLTIDTGDEPNTGDPLSREFILGGVIRSAFALKVGLLRTDMSSEVFRHAVRQFVSTLPSDPAYGSILDFPGVARLLESSTTRELCELAAVFSRDRIRTIETEWPPDEHPARVLRQDRMLLSIYGQRWNVDRGDLAVRQRGTSRERRPQTRRGARRVRAGTSRDGPESGEADLARPSPPWRASRRSWVAA
jgi:hypothetical protein